MMTIESVDRSKDEADEQKLTVNEGRRKTEITEAATRMSVTSGVTKQPRLFFSIAAILLYCTGSSSFLPTAILSENNAVLILLGTASIPNPNDS